MDSPLLKFCLNETGLRHLFVFNLECIRNKMKFKWKIFKTMKFNSLESFMAFRLIPTKIKYLLLTFLSVLLLLVQMSNAVIPVGR